MAVPDDVFACAAGRALMLDEADVDPAGVHGPPGPSTGAQPAGEAPAATDTDPLLTVREAARLVGRTDRTVRRWIEKGDLPAVPVDGRMMVKTSDMAGRESDIVSTAPKTDGGGPSGLIPVSELAELFARLAEAQRDTVVATERAGRAEEREGFQSERRSEVEAERDRLRDELADAQRRLAAAEAINARHDAVRAAAETAPEQPGPAPRRRWLRTRRS